MRLLLKTASLGALAASGLLMTVAPSEAANCSTHLTLASIASAGSCNNDGGWTFNYISQSGFIDGTRNPLFTFSGINTATLSLQGDPFTFDTNGTLNYSIAPPPGRSLTTFSSAITSSRAGAAGKSAVTSSQAGKTALGTYNDPNGVTSIQNYSGTPTSDTLSLAMTVEAGNITQLSSSYTSALIPPPDTTPGPLPLLGAATAFAFSRNLRKRISLA